MFQNFFDTILNLSITASIVAVFIIIVRLVFSKKLPRIYCYTLWAIVLARLLIPFSFTSVVSIFNFFPTTQVAITQSSQHPLSMEQKEVINKIMSNDIEATSPAAVSNTSADPVTPLKLTISFLWVIGAASLFLFNIFAYLRVKSILREAVLYKENDFISECSLRLKLKRKVKIYVTDRLCTPIVYGLIRPRIILPAAILKESSQSELRHIITHELVHIKRFDYLFKPISMLTLCVHWFNPVIWFSFILSQKDMEMSCDERVISAYDNDIRKEYAASLIKLAVRQNVLLNSGLLAFGESNIKSRIKGIMKYKKPKLWLGTAAVILLITTGAVLLTNGQAKRIVYKEPVAAGGNTQPETTIGENNQGTQPSSESEKNDINPGMIDIRKFDLSKMENFSPFETVVINDCLVKDGPGDNFKTVGSLKYGDIVIAADKYNKEWVIFSSIKDPNHQFWVKASNLFDDQLHQDINYGIITAKEVTVGETTRKQGNLIRVLIKDKDKSCVTIPVIDINAGKTGWIENKDYTIAKPGVYFNQAFLKKDTKIYTEPSVNSPIAENGEVKDGGLFVFINKEQGDWVSVSSYGPVDGWVKKENIYIPMPSDK